MMKNKAIALSSAVLIALSTVIAGCGINNTTTGGSNTTSGTPASAYKVGLVTDTGGLNDHGFNHLSDVGLENAKTQLGVTGSVVQSTSAASYVPNLTNFARQGYGLVIAVGYLMHDAVEQVSKEYPKTKFLIIDDTITDRTNVASAIFKTEQCGYLVGAMAGLLQQTKGVAGLNSKNVFGVVGGLSIPPVDSYIAGFQQGVKKTDPSAKVEIKYANSFTDQTLGSQIAQSEISDGADILFQVAGGTGIGVIDAAKNAKIYAIGVDADQNYLAPSTVITSALKGVDTATFDVIKEAKTNTFKSGVQLFDLSNNGVGIGKTSSVISKTILTQVNALAAQIKSGSITVSSTVTK